MELNLASAADGVSNPEQKWRLSEKYFLQHLNALSAPLMIGGARVPVEVYLADGTVSAGMSGGPVAYEASGWAGSGVIGIIHGYWPLSEVDLASQKPEYPMESVPS